MPLLFDKLSDCALLCLLEYLDSTALYQLSQVSSRFEELVSKKSLWKVIDARDEPNDEKKIDFVLDRVHNLTEVLLMKGRKVYLNIVGMLQANAFECLTILALENQFITQHVKLENFPNTLVELSFKNSVFDLSSEFFRKSYEAMGNLRVLIIDGCRHISTSTLMSVSKYPNLEIFSCYKCPIENSIAYFSIAVSNGFKKIKVFDVRLSGLGNTFLRAFMKKSHIAVIYFQNCDKSYEFDFRDRATELMRMNLPVPRVTFHTLVSTGTEDSLVTDMGMFDLTRTTASDEKIELPESYLYKYPYPPCTCGFKEKQENNELGVVVGGPRPDKSIVYIRGEERKLIEIISEDNLLSDDDEWETDDEDFESETDNTEREPISANSNGIPASAVHVYLDPFHVFQPAPRARPAPPEQPEEELVYFGNDADNDEPSTSGLSQRKRKMSSDEDEEGGKRAKKGASSTDDDDEDGHNGGGQQLPDGLDPATREELAARQMLPDEIFVIKVPQRESMKKRIAARNRRRQRRAIRNAPILPPPEPPRPPHPTRTQVFQCGCGAHSVIVVTAEESATGPPVHPIETLFRPHQCEQRINLSDQQFLRVINRNEEPNARPEVELLNMDRYKKAMSGLRQISLRGYNRVTNMTLGNIEHLNLDLIDLTYTQCTKQGVLEFLRSNPNCRVLHKEFCVCKPRMDF